MYASNKIPNSSGIMLNITLFFILNPPSGSGSKAYHLGGTAATVARIRREAQSWATLPRAGLGLTFVGRFVIINMLQPIRAIGDSTTTAC
jgi:hypothetical protein